MERTTKIVGLSALAKRVARGSSLALGGSFLHRGPFAFVRELIRQGRGDLEIIKQSPGYDLDLLCRAGLVRRVRAGIVAIEGNFGLATWYRRAIESREIELEEHACMTLTAGLRAAAYGVPFQPCPGLHGSDLPKLNGWREINDPYGSGSSVYVIPSIRPDFAVIHASEVDEAGDVRVYGTFHWDRIMSRAAKRVLVTAERLASDESFVDQPELTLIPSFMVEAVSIVRNGAWPGSSYPFYGIDYEAITRYRCEFSGALNSHLAEAPETCLYA
jgi:glutaconate CoA-transferase subunit A